MGSEQNIDEFLEAEVRRLEKVIVPLTVKISERTRTIDIPKNLKITDVVRIDGLRIRIKEKEKGEL